MRKKGFKGRCEKRVLSKSKEVCRTYDAMGKCMYSGEPIDLSRLGVDYDIDHIHPQMRVKDDSITNRVLVKKELNAAKGDKYPIPDSIRSNPEVRKLWTTLKAKKLINDERYARRKRPSFSSLRSSCVCCA